MLVQQRDPNGRPVSTAERLEFSPDEILLQTVQQENEDLSVKETLQAVFLRCLVRRITNLAFGASEATFAVSFHSLNKAQLRVDNVTVRRRLPGPVANNNLPAAPASANGASPAAWTELELAYIGAARTVTNANRIASDVLLLIFRVVSQIQDVYTSIIGLVGRENTALKAQVVQDFEAHRTTLGNFAQEIINLQLGGERALLADKSLEADREAMRQRDKVLMEMGNTLIHQVGTFGTMFMANKGNVDPRFVPLLTKLQQYQDLMEVLLNPDLVPALEHESTRLAAIGMLKELISAVQEQRKKKENG